MPRILGFMIALGLAGTALETRAEPVLSQLYGQGVHQFFSGDYASARQSLSEAIDSDSRDPRVYYYRALANSRLGDQSAAQRDFQLAASLEQTPAGRQYAVSRALQRIQGRERQTLERYRAAAKMTAYREAEARRQARYGHQRQNDLDVLREQSLASPEGPASRQPPQSSLPPAEPAPRLPDVAPAADARPALAGPADVAAPSGAPADDAPTAAEPARPAEGAVPAPVLGGILRRAIGNTLTRGAAPPGAAAPGGAARDAFEGLEDEPQASDAGDDSTLFELEAPPPTKAATPAAPAEADPFGDTEPEPEQAAPAPSRPAAAAPADAADDLPELPSAEPEASPDVPSADGEDSLDDALFEPGEPPASTPLEDGQAEAPAALDDAGDSLDEPPAAAPAENEEGDSLDAPSADAPPADPADAAP